MSGRETAHLFGEPARLVGILSHPESLRPADAGPPTALFLDPGMIHRIGPQRLWVRLARLLAVRGWRSLRFDYSGVGDSPPRRDRMPFYESRLSETAVALDWLAENGEGDRFILIGLCTGADYGFETALADDRVVGLVLLDPYPFRTRGWRVRYEVRRLFRPRVWWRALTGRYGTGGQLLRQLRPVDAPAAEEEVSRVIPTRDEMADRLRLLVARNVRMLLIYTGGMPAWYNHAGQFAEAFGDVRWKGVVNVAFVEEADHIITPLGSQSAVLDRIMTWLAGEFETAHDGRASA